MTFLNNVVYIEAGVNFTHVFMIIKSILDNDFYKLTMMYAVLEKFPKVGVKYKFINRSPEDEFSESFYGEFLRELEGLSELRLTKEELVWLEGLKVFPRSFLERLKEFRLDPGHIKVSLSGGGELSLEIEGPWWETILFEVPVMAIIAEVYGRGREIDILKYREYTKQKGIALNEAGCIFSDFGTRRRFSFGVQEAVVDVLSNELGGKSGYVGTSNMFFSMKHGTFPIGTMAHEWIMGHAGLFGVEHANYRAMKHWNDVYHEKFSIALTDTYTSDTFFEDFSYDQAVEFHGLRQDSGDPIVFVDKALDFYEKKGIDAREKKIVFSDALTYKKAIEIQKYVNGRIIANFGIGTHFTNDFPEFKALNIVIKLAEIEGVAVYKTTDSVAKSTWKAGSF